MPIFENILKVLILWCKNICTLVKNLTKNMDKNMFAIKTDDVKQHVCTDMCITTTSEKTFYLSCFAKVCSTRFQNFRCKYPQ